MRSDAKMVVIVLSAIIAALTVHGLFSDASRADAHVLPATGVPFTFTDAYWR